MAVFSRAKIFCALENPHALLIFFDMTEGSSPKVKVWFDGACPLCLREINLMRRLDRERAVEFIDVSEDGVGTCPIDRSELLARFHAEEDGQMLSGAAAFAAMWRAIPSMRWLGRIARNQTVLRVLEWLYLRFLVVRPALQKLAR